MLDPYEDTQLSNLSVPISPSSRNRTTPVGIIFSPSGSCLNASVNQSLQSDEEPRLPGYSELHISGEELVADVGFEIDELGNVVENFSASNTPGQFQSAVEGPFISDARPGIAPEHAGSPKHPAAVQVCTSYTQSCPPRWVRLGGIPLSLVQMHLRF